MARARELAERRERALVERRALVFLKLSGAAVGEEGADRGRPRMKEILFSGFGARGKMLGIIQAELNFPKDYPRGTLTSFTRLK